MKILFLFFRYIRTFNIHTQSLTKKMIFYVTCAKNSKLAYHGIFFYLFYTAHKNLFFPHKILSANIACLNIYPEFYFIILYFKNTFKLYFS
jgi:hypothetical protein